MGEIRDKSDLWLALIIGLMIIATASFNYLGLLKNKLLNKTYEHSIRRINGSTTGGLLTNFMFENLIIILIAFSLGLGIISWIIPFFDELAVTDLKFVHFFMKDGLLIMSLILIFLLLVTWIFSFGKISNQSISMDLTVKSYNRGKLIQIPAFNIIQVAISVVLLICSFFIIKQMKYITNRDIGLNKDVIEVKLPQQYAEKANVFREEISKNPSVDLVSITPASPLLEYMMALFHFNDDGADKQYSPAIFMGDENFINTLGITLLEGRNFSGNISSDKNNCLVNEAFVRMFQGRKLLDSKLPGDDERIIVGIVRDFNYSGLKDKIEPGIIVYNNTGNHLLIKPVKGMITATRKSIKETWEKIVSDYPVDIESVRERYEWYHRENTNYVKLIGCCCIISLFLSMIGLFAVSLNTSRKRTKEIRIRKINGASVAEIMGLLNRDFLLWVLAAYVSAVPVSGYVMHKWLENFAYKTALSWWIFAIAGVIAFFISLLTVSWHSWRVAIQNPAQY